MVYARAESRNSLDHWLVWTAVSVLGAFALAMVAIVRGEHVSALWMVVAAIAVYLIAYRYYSLFLARTVLQLDADRPTPAHRHNDGLDYVPTNKYVLFGHHFAAIAGSSARLRTQERCWLRPRISTK